ncbi:MAG: S4 domain-containing protein, partial [Actinomycetota bacterium]|nr:S4 domain-containing protein [Actinomycetota bacterium]
MTLWMMVTMEPTPTSSGERLNRFLARSGVSSRRGAEEIMASGQVSVNGVVVREPGAKIDPETDVVEVDGVRVGVATGRMYVMLNKPTGYVSTLSDPQGRKTIAEL